MVDDAVPSPPLLLTYAIDEITECLQLIRFGPPDGTSRTSWPRWLRVLFRTRAQVVADQRLMYLNENVDRARDHWRQALAYIDGLAAGAADDEVMQQVVVDLRSAGIDGIAAKLRHSELPIAVPKVVAYLDGVAAEIAGCKATMIAARNRVSLRTMRTMGTMGEGGA